MTEARVDLARTRPAVDRAILGGLVADGTGSPARALDVLIRDGRVLDLVAPGSYRTPSPDGDGVVIEASGRVVAPGFVDLHSHADFTLSGQNSAESALAQGVTTIVTGNCGWSPFPHRSDGELARLTAPMNPDLRWTWSDQAEFVDTLTTTGIGVNVAPLVGHIAVRLASLGSADRRPPSSAEQREMERLVDQAADDGVVGLSTGLIYAPGSFAASEEVEGLVSRAASRGLMYATHMRNESGQLVEAAREALDVARRTGVRLQISHLKAMGPANHGMVHDVLDLIDRARADGVDVACDVYPYTASSTMLTSRLPNWALDGGPAGLLARLRDPAMRRRVRDDLHARFGTDVDPGGVVIVDDDARLSGQSLVDLSEAWHTDPAEAALRVLEQRDGTVLIVNHAMAEDDVEAVIAHPHAAVASDGWVMEVSGTDQPHPRSFGTFARLFQRYVRERRLLTVEDAVRKVTSVPAARAGLPGRGILSPGAHADVVVFDPGAITEVATFADPRHLAVGVDHVLVGGRTAFESGRVSALHGRVLLTES